MESRYALRELEGAIGSGPPSHSGQRVVKFAHTYLHRRAKRDLFERRDIMAFMMASYVAKSAFASSRYVDFDDAIATLGSLRDSVIKMAFPYVAIKEKKRDPERYDDYKEYFDELDAIEAAEKGRADGNDIINT